MKFVLEIAMVLATVSLIQWTNIVVLSIAMMIAWLKLLQHKLLPRQLWQQHWLHLCLMDAMTHATQIATIYLITLLDINVSWTATRTVLLFQQPHSLRQHNSLQRRLKFRLLKILWAYAMMTAIVLAVLKSESWIYFNASWTAISIVFQLQLLRRHWTPRLYVTGRVWNGQA